MKKVIRLLFYVLAACLLAFSCTKTDSNTFALLGNWELIKTEISANGETRTVYPQDIITRVEFSSKDEYTWVEVSIGGITTRSGKWYVDEETVVLTQASGDPRVFDIVETSLSRLVLRETLTVDGVTTVYTDTYKYITKEEE